jgi:hypothetical protein
VPSHALPPGENRARNRARRRSNVRSAILAGRPAITVIAIVSNGRQEHASAVYYLIGVPVIVVLNCGFYLAVAAASRLAARSVHRRPRWVYGCLAIACCAPAAIVIRLAIEHDQAHTLNEGGWASLAGGLLATYGVLGALLMLGRAVVPGQRRRAFWLFPPQWLDHELMAGPRPGPGG